VHALTVTALFEAVQNSGANGLAGHWIYMAHQTAKGTTVSRPVYFSHSEGPATFVEPQALREAVRMTIAQDFDPSRRMRVGIQCTQDGGALLAPQFRPVPA
jgi:hypothetical protein